MSHDYVIVVIFINLYFQAYLLNAQPLECCEAARGQLVAIVANPQLSIAIVAPAINLDKHKTILCTV